MEILVDGRPLAEHPARGTTYIEALRSQEYAVRLRNNTGRRIAVALAVDGHRIEELQTPDPRLLHRLFENLSAQALDLDVHLQGGDALACACDLEIHIAQVVLHALDVGQHLVGAGVLVHHQAHGDACHGGFERHAGIHQGQGAAADAGLRGRAV